MFRLNSIKFLTVLSALMFFATLDVQAVDSKSVEQEELNENLFDKIQAGDITSVQNLINQGANIEAIHAVNGIALTPLLLAVMTENDAMAKTLLNAGADPKATIGTGSNMTALHLAIESGNHAMVKTLLDAGVDPKSANFLDGNTVLHEAATKGNLDVVHSLLKSGAEVDAQNDKGETALHKALFPAQYPHQSQIHNDGNDQVANALVSAGADVNAKANDGDRPIHLAARNLNSKNVKMLADHGADVTALNARAQSISDIVHDRNSVVISSKNYQEQQNIDEIYRKYSNLHNSPEAFAERKTLFGQNVMGAYDRYLEEGDPTLLAQYLGVDQSANIPTRVVRRAKNMFKLNGDVRKLGPDTRVPQLDEQGNRVVDAHGNPQFVHQGEPLIMNQLRRDYAAHLAAQNAAKTAAAPKSADEEVR